MAVEQPTGINRPIESAVDGYEGQIGDGKHIPTVIESRGRGDDIEERCPYCGNWYSQIGSHWSHSVVDCTRPPISKYKMELLKGMMLGDGCLRMDNKYPYFDLRVTNGTFLEWLDGELGWLTLSLSISQTATGIANDLNERGIRGREWDGQPNNCLDIHRLTVKSHPQYEPFEQWYESGKISFPEGLTVSPIALKLWYVSDGSLMWNGCGTPAVQVTSKNESKRPETIVGALEEYGFTVGHTDYTFYLSTTDTDDFFELIGDAPDGFQYKWAYEDRERYDRLKEKCREEHCTQTLE